MFTCKHLLAIAAIVWAPLSFAAQYRIDSAQSFVRLEFPEWQADPTPPGQPQRWSVATTPQQFSLSGFLDVTTFQSPALVDVIGFNYLQTTSSAPLEIRNQLVQSADFQPGTGQFSLLGPCNVTMAGMGSCFGLNTHYEIQGELLNGLLTAQGEFSSLFPPFLGIFEGPNPPPFDTPNQGPYNFTYSIVAFAIPEPSASVLFLSGLLMVLGMMRIRR